MSGNSIRKDHVGVGVGILDNGDLVVAVFENRDGNETVIRLARTRKQVDDVIAALERCKQQLPKEPKNDDASNLPPISNKVEGGGHFGLG